ncbi:MAG: ATP-binding cassette domain-containing protein, partial [Cyanobacteria bacterium K_DeepCast_35m_m2_023]|nr:ATP-binding cassette domain-containing protein [Cyanobacteria bacterium K_DeepCast_35m_m2_023]
DRTQAAKAPTTRQGPAEDWVYALKDISFEVKRGEVLGIIGRNGAGKSTLLKILSRVTTQSSGRIKVKGRIASLLEVGTGFHPELTGRENIFLNGAILGMRRAEIASMFDEIIDFSGCARYIDTPVKRYSSGMYVRLAFAVAAHLEPEILIVDEVLAVGDAEFQRKCIGKMQDVANGGRTVIFVSHNMSAVSSLCSKGLILMNGRCNKLQTAPEAVSNYLASTNTDTNERRWKGCHGDESIKLLELIVSGPNPLKGLETHEPIVVTFKLEVYKPIENCVVAIFIESIHGTAIATSAQYDDLQQKMPTKLPIGIHHFAVEIPRNTLSKGVFRFVPDIGIHNVKKIVGDEASVTAQVENSSGLGLKFLTGKAHENLIRPNWNWSKLDAS